MATGSQSQPSSQQSFSMSQQSQPGTMYRSFNDVNVHGNDAPRIYSAVYSGVDVYEMEVNNIAVMRRRNDSWLNATQILKVAGVDKGKRTKILEKEIQATGDHEKVQGGYGKYQGTWVKFERGLEVCRQYGVEELLRPLLTYDMGQDGGVAGRGDLNTPTKEQAMAAMRKRMYNASAENRNNGAAGPFFKSISSTASHAVAAMSKARYESPGVKNRNGVPRAPSFSRQPSMSQNPDDFPNSQQSYVSDYGQAVDSAYSTQQSNHPHANDHQPEPPRKRQRVAMTPLDSFAFNGATDSYANAFPASPTEPNESFLYTQAGVDEPHDGFSPLPPLPYEMSPDAEHRKSLLLSLFLDTNSSDEAKLDIIKSLSPRELDMPIDNHSHTVLHWAAALSRLQLLRALIAAGASPFRINASGHTALMRAVTVTNSMELTSFPDLLDVLGGTLEIRDNKGRTVLHHIAVTSAVKGRNAASRYYLESLLEWIVRQGSVPSSQHVPSSQQTTNGPTNGLPNSSQQPQQPKMGLARFMAEIVNAQDNVGDTALNIAAKNGNRSVISQLLEVGADNKIANRSGLCPLDFGVGSDNVPENGVNGDAMVIHDGAAGNTQRGKESRDEMIQTISHLLDQTTSEFQAELRTKQSGLDNLHSSIRASSSQLAEARKQLETLQDAVRRQQLARQQIINLSHAREDEQARFDPRLKGADAVTAWETELGAALETADADGGSSAAYLPSANLLRARIKAVVGRDEVTRKMVQAMKGRSREVEVKYRKIVALCTSVPEGQVDSVIEGLLRAVESERGELEIGRVRKFLGGVEDGPLR
ncbi:related to transcription factor [Cephalotrichum gorgonifer]|uniref:Transcription factor SWI6 n=1 Tax=Cephalotrichum gorgonifer TaxID=2041049 RepID=A0AAE8MXJ6_9PEZI|nr:related to transcription factor [Cephalotrichum gorgonifer]